MMFAQITEDLLPFLSGEDLITMGIQSLGPRRRILEAIASWSCDGAAQGDSLHPIGLPAAYENASNCNPGQGRQKVTSGSISTPARSNSPKLPLHPAEKGKITMYLKRSDGADLVPQAPKEGTLLGQPTRYLQ